MEGPWRLTYPISRWSFCGTTRSLCHPGATRVLISSEPIPSRTRPSCSQTRGFHRFPRFSKLTESRRPPPTSKPSTIRGRPLRINSHSGRRQSGWKPLSQNHGFFLEKLTQGLYPGPSQRRYLSHTSSSSQQPAQEHHTPPTCIDLFAGIGLLHLALKKNGLKCVYANEPDPEARSVFERNHARDSPGLTLDHRDITQVPLEHIPDHKLLAAWLPHQHRASQSEKLEPWRARIFEIVEAKRPPIVLVGTTHGQPGGRHSHQPPGRGAQSHRLAVHMTQELDALGYRTKFAYYDYASFDLPLLRWNLFIVGVRADQNALFEFKPAPGRSPGLGLHRYLLPPDEVQQGQSKRGMRTQLIDGVWVSQRYGNTGRIGELSWTILDALPPNPNKLPYISVGHWLPSDSSNPNLELIGHHLGFARGLGQNPFRRYLVPGPDGRPMVRRLVMREVTRIQGLPDEFLLHPLVKTASRQIGDSGSPPILDWVVKSIKEQFPQIFSTNGKGAPNAVASPHATTAST